MLLSELAAGFPVTGFDREIRSITEDSRKVAAGALFVAIAGSADDGHAYIDEAVGRGAVAVAGERLAHVPPSAATVQVPDSRQALAVLAARFHGHPARDLHLIGFTGTFGKTSTSEVLRLLLAAGGARPGVLGSLGAKYGTFHGSSGGLTTPAPVELHGALRRLRDAGADTVVMEVTSHALRMRRVAGLQFGGGLLAAIEAGEHTDFHTTFDDYVAAKRLFLDCLAPDALLAYDADNAAARTLALSRASGASVGFSLRAGPADLVFDRISLDAAGASFRLDGPLLQRRARRSAAHMRSALLGAGHLRNVALALTYAIAAGVDADVAAPVLTDLHALPRRMERYSAAGRTVLDDTAAHPDSFRATFAVAGLLPHRRLVVAYAVRGHRGVDINSRNAAALAELAAEHRVDALIVTASRNATGAADRVTDAELTATLDAFSSRGCPFTAHDLLRDAMAHALDSTGPGDLIVLIGAQGMNDGRRLLDELAR